jgi:hypothetical protein
MNVGSFRRKVQASCSLNSIQSVMHARAIGSNEAPQGDRQPHAMVSQVLELDRGQLQPLPTGSVPRFRLMSCSMVADVSQVITGALVSAAESP